MGKKKSKKTQNKQDDDDWAFLEAEAAANQAEQPKEEEPTVLEDLNDILCGTGDDEKTESDEKNASAITAEDEENIKSLQEMVPVKTVVTKKDSQKGVRARMERQSGPSHL